MSALACACHSGAAAKPDVAASEAAASAPDVGLIEPAALDLWTRAEAGELDDLARLYRHEGSDRLIEVAADKTKRITALRALAFSEDLTPLPFLAAVASAGTDEEATESLLALCSLLSQPRRALDPEDALEVAEGVPPLLALARDAKAPRGRRILAVRALRMLEGRGAVAAKDIPTDLDAR